MTPEITVATAGPFMLLDRDSGREISHEGATTVPLTPFVRERLALGQLYECDADGNRRKAKPAQEAPAPAPAPAEEEAPAPAPAEPEPTPRRGKRNS